MCGWDLARIQRPYQVLAYRRVNIVGDAVDGVFQLHARLVTVVVIDVVGLVMFQQSWENKCNSGARVKSG